MKQVLRQGVVRLIALSALTTAAIHAGPVYGTNWVVNGDAESGAGANDANTTVPVPDWSSLNGSTMFTAVQYQINSGGFPSFSDPIASPPGNNFFAGGPIAGDALGAQTFDVSSLASEINQDAVSFTLSAFLGGFADQDDYATFAVLFLDAGQNVLDEFAVTGPSAAERGDATSLVFESTSGIIPAGTQTLRFELQMFYQEGAYNDGYADDLSFTAESSAQPTSAPEPGSWCLLASGLALAAIVRRRAQ